MKTSHLAAVPAVVLAMSALLPSQAAAQQNTSDPNIPVGWLDAFPTLVQTGTHPTLTWDISYPEKVIDVVDIDPDDGTITPKKDLWMDIRILGAEFQSGSGYYQTVQAYYKVNNGGWTRVFNGTHPQVNPTRIVESRQVQAARPLDFLGRAYLGSWLSSRYTGTSSSSRNTVVALVDGDRPPSYAPAFNQGNIKSFLRPYLDEGGNIDIGPRDVIFLFELYSTSPGSSFYDMQDLVVLVTFRDV